VNTATLLTTLQLSYNLQFTQEKARSQHNICYLFDRQLLVSFYRDEHWLLVASLLLGLLLGLLLFRLVFH
jgi:hypothetical protein